MRRHEPERPGRAPESGPERDSQPPPSAGAKRANASGKRERSAALTQERILDAGEQEFAARGFAGARLREIAVGAGIQPALIHHYFADKQGLYEAVIRRAVDQMSTASWRVLETQRDVEGIVRGFVDVMVDFSAAHQKLLAIMRSEVLAGAGLLVDIVREKTHVLLEAVVGMVGELQKSGQLRGDVEAREMVRSGLSLILYPIVDAPVLEILLPEEGEHATLERRKKVILSVLLSGIGNRA
ncbi:MAG: TetR/AcrR family transcriptional regulator [Polyangiaceae bacterium]|jgi:TetR/AcrR family transcriptional regulator|nr:TetR/AcrR family transcriptional regulator [Polyangiaceae bacterium]MBK8938316.1 TetR/AcrR family transcriptional regulator [Polyangiaceae bacterium]